MAELHIPRVAILASGSGTTAEAFIHATQSEVVEADVGLVICNNSRDSFIRKTGRGGIYDRITRLNKEYGLDIEVATINARGHEVGEGEKWREGDVTLAESEALAEKLVSTGVAHVALMGYMKILKGAIVDEYGWLPHYDNIYDARMSNTHPGPLPETENTWGIHASERVMELYRAGELVHSKHTFHLVAEGVDKGPKIVEHSVDILEDDTPESLFDRVQVVEKHHLPLDIGNFLMGQGEYGRPGN